MAYPTVIYGTDSQAYEVYSAAGNFGQSRYPIGTQLVVQDGRKWRFAMAGASTLVVGNVLTGVVPLATDVNMTPAAGAIGDRLITFTHGAAVTVANYFAEGYAVISVTPGGGDTYKILGHLALASAAAGDIVNLAPGNALRRDLSGTSRLDLINHPYSRVIQAPVTTLAAVPVGVAVSAPTTLKYCFVQTRGVAGVLGSGTNIAGTRGVAGVAAGAIGPETAVAATSKLEVTIGTIVRAAATAAWSSVFLTIDG